MRTKRMNRPLRQIDGLNKFQMVALDDLGAERDTEYAVEQLESFVNGRDLSGKPLIVTTNLLRKDMDNPTNVAYARVFDRVKKQCCSIEVTYDRCLKVGGCHGKC